MTGGANGIATTSQFVDIPDPDVAVYRVFQLRFFEQMLASRQLSLVAPRNWEDPHEDITSRTVIVHRHAGALRQVPFAEYLSPVFAQCWSHTGDSDALQRAYSRVVKDPDTNRDTTPHEEGVRVRSTPRKLVTALRAWSPTPVDRACFIGAVMYANGDQDEQIEQEIANRVGRYGPEGMKDGRLRAELLLMKRKAFQHEAEVRLIYVENRDVPEAALLQVPIDPNDLFDDVAFDPRLAGPERQEREASARRLGYTRRFGDSMLYDRIVALMITLDD